MFDESIRRARSIPDAQIEISPHLCDLLTKDKAVTSAFPKTKLRVECSKLHIYEQGGHFAVHSDTIRNNTHIGNAHPNVDRGVSRGRNTTADEGTFGVDERTLARERSTTNCGDRETNPGDTLRYRAEDSEMGGHGRQRKESA